MKFLDTRSFSSRSMSRYVRSIRNGSSLTVILQRVTLTNRASLTYSAFSRGETRGQKMRKDSQFPQGNFGLPLKASNSANANVICVVHPDE
jgi:hypothetical protein